MPNDFAYKGGPLFISVIVTKVLYSFLQMGMDLWAQEASQQTHNPNETDKITEELEKLYAAYIYLYSVECCLLLFSPFICQ